jgi:D-xylose 1-dehydrogenase (NADP+, D-xylono-1,5-lactone-forming)
VVIWGLLSTARINDAVLAGAALSDEVHVAAVASRDADRAEAYAREHGIERVYGSYEALLADPELEAVYLPLPNALHVDWAIRGRGDPLLGREDAVGQARAIEMLYDAAGVS